MQPKAYGIDVGKDYITIATADENPPRMWPVERIETRELKKLKDKIVAGSTVSIEPTGYWYSRPVIKIAEEVATVIIVAHSTTATHRAEFAGAKTDAMDARALALISKKAITEKVKGTKIHKNTASEKLRLAINEQRRHTRSATRAINQAGHLIAAVYPGITPARLLTHGTADPSAMEKIAATAPHGSTRNSARAILEAKIINEGDEHIIEAINQLINDYEIAKERAKKAEEKITQILEEEFKEITEAWRTIPNTGDILIAALIVAAGDPRETTVDEFKAMIGVNPISYESGKVKTVKRGRGYKPTREYIHLWTMRSIKEEIEPIAEYAKRKGLSAAKRKAAHLFYGVAKNPPYRPK